MFLHKENQQLLWQTLQKTPYLVEFTQKFAGHREEWFRGAIEQFYTQWISRNNRMPTNAKELLEINKYALQVIVLDLKRLLGYTSSLSSQQSRTSITQNELPSYQTVAASDSLLSYQTVAASDSLPSYQTVAASDSLPSYQTVAASDSLPSYDINADRKHREEQWSTNFNKYQTEYNQLLKQPAVPTRGLPSETSGDKIKNMDELIREHTKMRDMDLSVYSPQRAKQVLKLDDLHTITNRENVAHERRIKLKILDEIERIEMHIDEHADILSTKKTVRFETEQDSTYQNEISSISQ